MWLDLVVLLLIAIFFKSTAPEVSASRSEVIAAQGIEVTLRCDPSFPQSTPQSTITWVWEE